MPSPNPATALSKARILVLLAVLWVAGLGAAGQFAKIGSVFADVQAAFPAYREQVGLLQSALGLVGIICGLFAGLLIARFGFRKMLIPALLLGAALSLVQASLPAFGWMAGTRIVEGLSHLVIVVAAPTLMAQISPLHWRAMVMSFWSTFFGMAFALTAFFGVPLVKTGGLSALFTAHAVVMAVSAVVLYLLLPKHVIPRSAAAAITPAWLWHAHVKAYRSPTIAAPALGWLAYALTYLAVVTLLPSYLEPESQAWAGVVLPLVSLVTTLLAGLVVLPRLSAYHTVIIGFALAGLMAAAVPFAGVRMVPAVLVFVGLGLVQAGSFALVPELLESAEDQAQANGAMAQLGNLGTALGTPLLFMAMQAFDLWGFILFAVLANGLGIAVHIWCAMRRHRALPARGSP